MMTALSGYPQVSHVQRYSTKPGMIKTDDAFQGMVLKGVGPEFDPSFMQEYLVEGEILRSAIRLRVIRYLSPRRWLPK